MVEQGYATVDREKCFSYAICIDIMPDTFHLDEDGISVAGVSAPGPLPKLIEAAKNCPMQAISVSPLESLPT